MAFRNLTRAEKDYAPTGIKYSNYGTTRTGLSSVMDSQIIKKNIAEEAMAYGSDPANPNTGGAYKFRMFSDTDQPITNAPLNMQGRIFYPAADGSFRIVDNKYLELMEKKFEEQEEYTSQIMKKCLISTELTAHVLGKPLATLRADLAGSSATMLRPPYNLPAELNNYNADIDFLNALDKTSIFYSAGMSKLRTYIKHNLVILSDETPASAIKEAE